MVICLGFDIIDTEKTKLWITCFNDVVDLHFDKVQVGSVYMLSGGTIKSANKFYNKLNSDFEITLTEDSTLSVCDDDLLILTLRYTFTPITEIMNMNINSTLDLIGIVICVDPD